MNNITDKTINIVKKKNKSGFVWIGVALLFLILTIPFLIYGLGRATYNGIVWVSHHPDRKLAKQQRKEQRAQTKDTLAELELKAQQRKENKKLSKIQAKQEKLNYSNPADGEEKETQKEIIEVVMVEKTTNGVE